MKGLKVRKILCLVVVLGITMSGTILNASNISKTLKAIYSNIKVSYNGGIKSLSTQPFMANGTIYVPLHAIGEIMGADVSFDNNIIYITDRTAYTVSYEQELAAKNYEIASLKQLLAKKDADYDNNTSTTSKGSNLSSSAVNKTLKQIEDAYDDDYHVDWDFDLRIVSSRLELTIAYDSNRDRSDFDDMRESERKSFAKKICSDIADRHEDVEIRGTIENSRTNKEISDFTYTKSGSFTYDDDNNNNKNTTLSDLENDLEHSYRDIHCINFYLPIKSVDLSEQSSGDKLDFTITTDLRANSNDYRTNWNDLINKDGYKSRLEDDLEDLLDDIVDDVEDERGSYDNTHGVIRDLSSGYIATYDNGNVTVSTVATN